MDTHNLPAAPAEGKINGASSPSDPARAPPKNSFLGEGFPLREKIFVSGAQDSFLGERILPWGRELLSRGEISSLEEGTPLWEREFLSGKERNKGWITVPQWEHCSQGPSLQLASWTCWPAMSTGVPRVLAPGDLQVFRGLRGFARFWTQL